MAGRKNRESTVVIAPDYDRVERCRPDDGCALRRVQHMAKRHRGPRHTHRSTANSLVQSSAFFSSYSM